MSERGSDANVLALAPLAAAWPVTLLAALGGLVAMAALYFSTVASAVHLWNTSSAYNYAYLIAPVSAALIWADRRQLARAIPAPNYGGVAVAGAFSVAWLAGALLGIDEGRHLAFVGMMQGLALALLGWRITRFLAFPLLYLFFLVPTGTFLLTPLQTLAHHANVALLKASGVPVYAEGFMIQVPAGSFLVEPGCAGLNFFLVALALSLLYGRLTYATMTARAVCVGTALLISIVANIVRIYIIIGLAQATNRRIDITADHLLYGWGFFGVVMLCAMWVGTKIKAKPAEPRILPAEGDAVTPPARQVILVGLAFIVTVSLSPTWAATSSGRAALETRLHSIIGHFGVLAPSAPSAPSAPERSSGE
ncbi:MAG: exosortase A [Rhodospirillaceae bacterium]